MNYFLVLLEINNYFHGVSCLDTKLIASGYASENQCYDSGVILLAPYGRKGAIIAFLDYTKMAALEGTISCIISYKDGSSLPESLYFMNE